MKLITLIASFVAMIQVFIWCCIAYIVGYIAFNIDHIFTALGIG